jgi:nicotinate-nucleotide adenylyltransferase
MTTRVGLLGGTFNPIHYGHLVLAEEARELLRLDEVWFMPVAEPPLKDEPELAPAQDRLRMVALAVADQPQFRASDLEIQRGGKSYTVDTLRALRQQHGEGVAWYFIVGADAAEQFASWRGIDDVLKLCRFVVARRPGYQRQIVLPGVDMIDIPLLNISATDIRQRLAQQRSIRFLVPEAVRRYLMDQALYQTPTKPQAHA